MTRTGEDRSDARASVLASYVPRLVEDVQRADPPTSAVFDGTLCRLTSVASPRSPNGSPTSDTKAPRSSPIAEPCFGQMIEACEERGGDIVKFGGDALLVLFTEEDHAQRAAAAMERMRTIVAQPWSTNSVKRVSARASPRGRTLVCSASRWSTAVIWNCSSAALRCPQTIDCEGTADRGQILLSAAMADLLPDAWLGEPLAKWSPTDSPGACGRWAGRGHPLLPLPAAVSRASSVPGRTADRPGVVRQPTASTVRCPSPSSMPGGPTISSTPPGRWHFTKRARPSPRTSVRCCSRTRSISLASDAYSNGAKLILTAGAPISTGADDDHLLLALHDLFAAPVAVAVPKAGVNRGHVYVGDLGSTTRRTFTVMGDAVNLAARLMQKAKSGQIVASASMLDRAETRFECEWLGAFLVKGKSKPIEAAVLGDPMVDESPGDR